MKRFLLYCIAFLLSADLAAAQPDLSRGVSAFENRQWSEAMESFLETLHQDPANSEAHAYVTLIARKMEVERQTVIRQHRLQMLGAASKRLDENRRDSGTLQQAILDTTQAEKNAREDRWRSRCEPVPNPNSRSRLANERCTHRLISC